MYAIIRKGNEKYYTSYVFGYYCKITSSDDYQKYSDSIYNQYYIVLNKEKNKLIKKYVFQKEQKSLIPQVLITDCDKSDWMLIDDCHGAADFIFDYIDDNNDISVPSDILQKCIDIDINYNYNEYTEIHTLTDIENLYAVSGYFHDAFIKEICEEENVLYILFDGLWGCKLELWLEDDISYDISKRNPEIHDPYWYGGSIILKDNYIYLIDEDIDNNEDIKNYMTNEYCWFKARKMKYHILPE